VRTGRELIRIRRKRNLREAIDDAMHDSADDGSDDGEGLKDGKDDVSRKIRD
jgi:hypothetical protein